MTRQEWIDRLLSDQKYRLKQAEDTWDRCVARIRDNPNELNVRGIWVGELLDDMVALHQLVVERDRALLETLRLVAELGKAES